MKISLIKKFVNLIIFIKTLRNSKKTLNKLREPSISTEEKDDSNSV